MYWYAGKTTSCGSTLRRLSTGRNRSVRLMEFAIPVSEKGEEGELGDGQQHGDGRRKEVSKSESAYACV